MSAPLPFINYYLSAQHRINRMGELYRDLYEIPETETLSLSSREMTSAVLEALQFNPNILQTLIAPTEHSPIALEAHFFTRIVLEDLFQNWEVAEDDYPTSPGLDDTDGMDAVFEEFNLPGEFEGMEF